MGLGSGELSLLLLTFGSTCLGRGFAAGGL